MEGGKGFDISEIFGAVGGLLEKITGNAFAVVIFMLCVFLGAEWYNAKQETATKDEINVRLHVQDSLHTANCEAEKRELRQELYELQKQILHEKGIGDTTHK